MIVFLEAIAMQRTFTRYAVSCSSSEKKTAGSFAGKQMQSSENLSRPTAALSATSIRLTKVFSIEFHSLSCAMARSSHHLMAERFDRSAAVQCDHRSKFLLPATTPAEIPHTRLCDTVHCGESAADSVVFRGATWPRTQRSPRT